MICGTSHIWPMPTGKVSLSSRSLTFKSNQLRFEVKTSFNEAKQLLHSAYDLFIYDLKSLEEQWIQPSTQTNLDKTNIEINGEKSDTVSGPRVDSAKTTIEQNANQNCDINRIIINAEIQKTGDVSLNMEMDESYELNVTSRHIQLSTLIIIVYSLVCLFVRSFDSFDSFDLQIQIET